MRKEKNAARRDSASPKPETKMPKYGLKKPKDEKNENKIIKRAVRKGGPQIRSGGFYNDV